MLLRGERIAFVGSEAEARQLARSGAEHIHVPGGLVVPGLNDSHIHMSYGAHALHILNLEGATTWTEVRSRLAEYGAAHPDREWIEAYGTPHEPFARAGWQPRELLDEVAPHRPVFVRAFDYHSAWCNGEALRRAGIERGATVQLPNEVVVDPETGLATGHLKERAAYGLVTALMPTPSRDELDRNLMEAMRFANKFGITSVQNMDGDPERLEQYERLADRGDLSLRACHYLSMRGGMPRERLREFAECMSRYASAWNRVGGIKLFIDGVVESKTALMLSPYADGSGDTGVPDMDLDAYREIVLEADRLGLDVATHAIGDRGVRLVLDVYAMARRSNPGSGCRHRVEHIEVIDPADIGRFAALGVTASMQPLHAAPVTELTTNLWTNLIGPEREPFAFAWRSLLEAGTHVAFGSDWSIVTPDVRAGLRTALARTDRGGEPMGGWQPQQSITLASALDAYTRGAAYAERQERNKGVLRAGMPADVAVLAHDLFRLTPSEIADVDVVLTVVGGRVVHRAI